MNEPRLICVWISCNRRSLNTLTSKSSCVNDSYRFSQSTFVPARAFSDGISKFSWLNMMAIPRFRWVILYSDAYRSTGIRATWTIGLPLLLSGWTFKQINFCPLVFIVWFLILYNYPLDPKASPTSLEFGSVILLTLLDILCLSRYFFPLRFDSQHYTFRLKIILCHFK